MFLLLEAEAVGLPTWVAGVVALVLLLGALMIVRGIGKSRPHS